MVVVMEFPNEDAYQEVLEGEAYQELVPHRDKAFKKLNLLASKE